jgi:hypothetical protein
MPGKVKFKRKPGRVHWAQRVLDWFPAAYRAAPQWLRGLFSRPAPDGPQATGAAGPARPKGLVIKDSRIHCPACGEELTQGAAMLKCTLDPTHLVHAQCGRELVRGRCPRDGAALIAAG